MVLLTLAGHRLTNVSQSCSTCPHVSDLLGGGLPLAGDLLLARVAVWPRPLLAEVDPGVHGEGDLGRMSQ